MKNKHILFFILANLFVINVSAKKADSCFYVQADLATRWIWRGVAYSETPVIQPSLGYLTDKINLSIWGSYPFERRAYSEIDFIVEYQLTSRFKLGLIDYFAINDSIGAKHKFFGFNRKTTRHMFDIYGVYKPIKTIPLSFLYSLWFWGADRNSSGKQNMSSYFEGKYEKKYGITTASIFVGMTPCSGFYAPHAAVVNMGVGISKPITMGGSISIPSKIEFVLNPESQNVYINAIFTIK